MVMSAQEFTVLPEGRVTEWYRNEARDWRGRRFGILEYLGMTADEYAQWVLTGVADDRVRRVWRK